MIVRDKKAYSNTDTCSLRLSYSEVDVKRCLVDLYKTIYIAIGDAYFHTPWSEAETRDAIAKSLFKEYPDKHSDDLARWAFSLALRKRFLFESATTPNTYFFSDCVKDEARKRAEKETR